MNKVILLIALYLVGTVSCDRPAETSSKNAAPDDLNVLLKERHPELISTYSHSQVDSIVNGVLKNNSIANTLGQSQDSIPYMVLARTKPGQVEIHEQIDDVAIIRSGQGTLRTGTEVGGKTVAKGEAPWRNWFCDDIKGGTDRRIAPGDFILIPAMLAHQYIPDQGDTLTYWTIKVKHVRSKED